MANMTTYNRGGDAAAGTALNYKTGTWRTQQPLHVHRPAPCHSVCPAGEDPQAYIARVDAGDPQGAWNTLVQANPLPAITGRVCDHPCEGGCNRSQFDQPLAIHNIELWLGDEAIRLGWNYPMPALLKDAATIAVVGAGPAGLSAAYHLRRRGLRVTLFDAAAQAGGTLRSALPPYRLPRSVLNAETERVLATGIDLRAHTLLGRDVSLEELRADYAAVFLGPGRQQSRAWNIDGRVPSDLHPALRLLQEWVALDRVPRMTQVAIVGGGNSAVDLARVLRTAGAQVHVITEHALPGPNVPAGEAMSAIPREIAQAQEEGVIFHPHRGITRLILRGEHVVGVEMVTMRKMPGAHGAHRVAFEGTESVLHVDQVIPAVGQRVAAEGIEALLRGAGLFTVDEQGVLPGFDNVFVGGDARTGSRGTVSGAIGDGRRAANAIALALQMATEVDVHQGEPLPYQSLNLNYFEHAPRQDEALLPVANRDGQREVALPLSGAQIQTEAARCFSCGNCLACDNCWNLCPDSAVLKQVGEGEQYVFDLDYCKGCGLCATECPTGYIAMRPEF